MPLALEDTESRRVSREIKVVLFSLFLLVVFSATIVLGQFVPRDSGVRGGTVDAGQPLASLAQTQGATDIFNDGFARFQEIASVQGGSNNGLGPRFNSDQCSSCHSQPAVGGTSPSATAFPFIGQNPQTLVFNRNNAQNTLPRFIAPDGPVLEARFKFFLNRDGSLSNIPDGGVYDLFVITGRDDADACSIKQPDFDHNLELNNVIFRIPTPLFGAGLVENISDETILANMHASHEKKESLGISGHPNRNGNDGTITRLGWKAQNKSLELFAGEAYNVEMGVTNEIFQNERSSPDEARRGGLPAACKLNPTPEDTTNFKVSQNSDPAAQNAQASDVVLFAMFMRLLAPPKPSETNPGGAESIANGKEVFGAIGCALCHTPTLQTGPSSFTPGLSNVKAILWSDLLVHHMGTNLADGVSQGAAGPDEFRTSPLWGLGQRIFFLHDGRTTDLLDVIRQHASPGSESNGVVKRFNRLTDSEKQDLLNFLRSL